MFEKGTTARATLVASGLYRFVRNPMYVCVVTIVAGQALLFGQASLFAYAGLLLLAFHLQVRLYEEPQLRRRFKESYETYCLHVRRWRPRLTPWRGPDSQDSCLRQAESLHECRLGMAVRSVFLFHR